jgi:dihydroorotate dehydrogenase (NAD+) catalytic subunit
MVSLEVNIGGVKLKNPVIAASGCFGYGEEFSSLIDINRLGAVVIKGLSINPRAGNPPPRIVEVSAGMLNSIGLQNIGLKKFLEDKLPFLKSIDVPKIINFFGESIEEYQEMAERLDDIGGIDLLEMNISCPNVKKGGLSFGNDPKIVSKLVSIVKRSTRIPLVVKLSPNVGNVVDIAKSAEWSGADALSLINSITGMAIDIKNRKPKLSTVTGGLSGPAIKPIALHMVWKVAKEVNIPVIGIGGIMDYEDVLEFLIAGATAIEVGTANFINPRVTIDIIDGIEEYLKENDIDNIKYLIASLNVEELEC